MEWGKVGKGARGGEGEGTSIDINFFLKKDGLKLYFQ